MRFTLMNTVPPGLCRKLHVLAPGGRMADLAEVKRDQLHEAGLSPTHMEVLQGLTDWYQHRIPPAVGFLLWFLESVQEDNGAIRRTDDAPQPAVGVPIRFLQIAGTLRIRSQDYTSLAAASDWLVNAFDGDGHLRMPASGLVDYGVIARALRSLHLVRHPADLEAACQVLANGQEDGWRWPTYPGSQLSTGATSLALSTIATCPDWFDHQPDPEWLLSARNNDGGWGEHPGSPSRVDNTFWASRAVRDLGEPLPDEVKAWAAVFEPKTDYERAMKTRLARLVGLPFNSADVERLALASLTDQSDRYTEASLYGLALVETRSDEQVQDLHDLEPLPIRTPEFIRREPPIYDQLAGITSRQRWLRTVNHLADARVVENAVGWLVGVSASLAVLSGELIAGLASLPTWVIAPLLAFEAVITAVWLGVRNTGANRLGGIPHFTFALLLGLGLMLLVTNPQDAGMDPAPSLALTMILTLIIDGVAVATDKADLLNRLDDD